MPDHHSHNRGHLPVNRLFGGKEPVDLDDGLPSDTERHDHRNPDPQGAPAPGAPPPRGPLAYAPPHIRAPAQQQSPAYFGRTIVDELASCPPDNSDIQAPADPAGDILAELGALAATSAERERRRAAGDDGGGVPRAVAEQRLAGIPHIGAIGDYPGERRKGTSPIVCQPGERLINAIERATRTSKAMAIPGAVDADSDHGAGPAGDDFAAVPREPTSTKSAMVRIMELTALVEQARALAMQALTDIGSANQSELAAAHDRVAACERTITERDARIVALEAAAQNAIEKLAGGSE